MAMQCITTHGHDYVGGGALVYEIKPSAPAYKQGGCFLLFKRNCISNLGLRLRISNEFCLLSMNTCRFIDPEAKSKPKLPNYQI